MILVAVASVLVAALSLAVTFHVTGSRRARSVGVTDERLQDLKQDLEWIVPWFREARNGHETLPAQVRSVRAGVEAFDEELAAHIRNDEAQHAALWSALHRIEEAVLPGGDAKRNDE